MLQLIGFAFFLVIFLYLALGVIFLFVFSLAGIARKKNQYSTAPAKKTIAVIIPTYKEDNIILDTATRAAHHNYPSDRFHVFIVADSLQPETIIRLKQLPI